MALNVAFAEYKAQAIGSKWIKALQCHHTLTRFFSKVEGLVRLSVSLVFFRFTHSLFCSYRHDFLALVAMKRKKNKEKLEGNALAMS